MQTAIAVKTSVRPAVYAIPMDMASALPRWHETPSPGVHGTRRCFTRDEGIFAEGEDTEFFYKIASGLVRTYKLLNDGRRQIDAFHFAGDIVGLESGNFHCYSGEAVCDATVNAYKRSALKAVAGADTGFADGMLAAMTRQLEHAQDHMLVLGCKNAREKIATFLLMMATRLSTGDCIELPMMRSDIADHLGLTIETVSRTMAELARRGVIGMSAGHRTIALRDLAALRRLSA